jgi:hypothetical protein
VLTSTEIYPCVFHIRKVFTPEECNQIVSEALEWKNEPGKVYKGHTDESFDGLDRDARKCISYHCPGDIMHNAWWKVKVDQAVIHYLRKAPTPPTISYKHVEVQMVEYNDTGDHFGMHRDSHLEADVGKTDETKIRKLSMSLELSDTRDYEDCKLIIATQDGGHCIPNSQQGDVTMFPSWHRHKVSPITSGTRRALIVWYHGPFWT